MNTKGNQRFLETKERIQQVFQELMQERDFSEITVAEICRRAGIHRTTFYGHYLDVPDLMDHMAQEMYGDFMGVFLADEHIHMKDGFIRMFTYIREHREFFRNYIRLSAQRNRSAEILPDMLEKGLDHIVRDFGYRSGEELLFHQTFFTGGLVALILRWIERGCLERPEDLYQILEDEYEKDWSIFRRMR